MTDEAAKPLPFAVLLRSTINPQAQVVVKHYALTKAAVWETLTRTQEFRARTEQGEMDALVHLANTVVNVLTWEDFEKLARQSQLVAPAAGAVVMPRGRG